MPSQVSVDRRFWQKMHRSSACWLWTAAKQTEGYGLFWDGQRMVLAHRFAYTCMVGPIPPGLQLDHLCRMPSCVNPAHLEPVTARENTMRGMTIPAMNAAKTHCVNGHLFDVENTYQGSTGRRCRACQRIRDRRRRRKAA